VSAPYITHQRYDASDAFDAVCGAACALLIAALAINAATAMKPGLILNPLRNES
jgi:hypothetical protein